MKSLITLLRLLVLTGTLLQSVHTQEDWQKCSDGSDLIEPPYCPDFDPGYPIYFPFPYDCRQYYMCSHNVAHCFHCAPGTIWDQTLERCNHESVTPCDILTTRGTTTATMPSTTESTTTPTTPTTEDPVNWVCPDDYVGLMRHPYDCRFFYNCDNGRRPCMFMCPEPLLFSQATQLCEMPHDVPECIDGVPPPPTSTTKASSDANFINYKNVNGFKFAQGRKYFVNSLRNQMIFQEDPCHVP